MNNEIVKTWCALCRRWVHGHLVRMDVPVKWPDGGGGYVRHCCSAFADRLRLTISIGERTAAG